jgi:hypothetical protein
VADATRADGSPAVLKVLVPGTGNNASDEATVLRLAGGDGCPVLYRYAPDDGALLMERLAWPRPSTTWVSLCGAIPSSLLGGDPVDRARWLAARTGSISSPSGSGALSSGCRQDCSAPASTCSPSAATHWRRPRPSPAR